MIWVPSTECTSRRLKFRHQLRGEKGGDTEGIYFAHESPAGMALLWANHPKGASDVQVTAGVVGPGSQQQITTVLIPDSCLGQR